MHAPRWTSQPCISVIAFLVVVGFSARARGDEEPIDLVYQTYESCPSERQFLAMVVGRAAKNLVASERARSRKFYVTVAPHHGGTIGRLEIWSGTDKASREVTGANCSEVVSALALFTALVIDPSASTEPPKPPEESARPIEPKRPPAPPPPIEPDTRPPPRPDRRRMDEVLTGVRLVGEGGFTGGSALPNTARGGGFFAQWRTPSFGAYRASGTYFTPVDTDRSSFRFLAGRLDGCPVQLNLGRLVVFEPCLAVELGAVSASAKAATGLAPSSERRWWVAGGLLGRARFAPFRWIFAELEGGASVPFTRYVFLLGTETDIRGEVHRVPAVGWVLGLGLGARIL
jgi:hypothetical protein